MDARDPLKRGCGGWWGARPVDSVLPHFGDSNIITRRLLRRLIRIRLTTQKMSSWIGKVETLLTASIPPSCGDLISLNYGKWFDLHLRHCLWRLRPLRGAVRRRRTDTPLMDVTICSRSGSCEKTPSYFRECSSRRRARSFIQPIGVKKLQFH